MWPRRRATPSWKTRDVGFEAVGHRADDGAPFLVRLVENLVDVVLAGNGEFLFAA
jgi:hypothetical protein